MEISRATLNKMAHLARLEFNDSESGKMISDMTEIVSWVEKLNEVDTTNVEPLISMSQEVNVLRADVITEQLPRDRALSQAPRHDDEYFRVPKVID